MQTITIFERYLLFCILGTEKYSETKNVTLFIFTKLYIAKM